MAAALLRRPAGCNNSAVRAAAALDSELVLHELVHVKWGGVCDWVSAPEGRCRDGHPSSSGRYLRASSRQRQNDNLLFSLVDTNLGA